MKKKKQGFTLIELIVIIAVLAIIITIAVPRYLGHTKEATLTKHKSNIKLIEDACTRYYADYSDWPKLTDIPYTAEELKEFSSRLIDYAGLEVEIDPNGNYYDIDFDALSRYVRIPKEDQKYYILRNSIGRVYYLDGITAKGVNRVTLETDGQGNIEGRTLFNLSFLGNENTKINKITDLSGNGVEVELKNFNHNSSSGWTEEGLKFDGANDYVLVPTRYMEYYKPADEITVTIRAYSPNWQHINTQKLLSCTEYGGWALGTNEVFNRGPSYKGYLVFLINTSGQNINYTVTKIKLSDISPGWHTFTFTYDGRFGKLYMDGVLYNTVDEGEYKKIIYNPNNALLIGAEPGGGSLPSSSGHYWNGVISHVAIYDRALTPAEVIKIYQELN